MRRLALPIRLDGLVGFDREPKIEEGGAYVDPTLGTNTVALLKRIYHNVGACCGWHASIAGVHIFRRWTI